MKFTITRGSESSCDAVTIDGKLFCEFSADTGQPLFTFDGVAGRSGHSEADRMVAANIASAATLAGWWGGSEVQITIDV